MIDGDGPTFGVLLNFGANLGPTPESVFDLTARQVDAAEALGYHDLWVTEHHAIDFGVNPSALTTAAFVLGRTRRIRVGTAVVLSPLVHPFDLAERVALLDQWSGGRFDLGLGRGGYVRDYQVLDVDTTRWDVEPETSVDAVLDLWQRDGEIRPAVRTHPHPPVLLATSTDKGIACAARRGLALQHYFATPLSARMEVEARYDACRPDTASATPAHLHTLIVIVADDAERARGELAAALAESFAAGDHPMVPQAPDRHVTSTGDPLDRSAMAAGVAAGAVIGSSSQVVDRLGDLITRTRARRLAIYHEAIADPTRTMVSLERFATEVAPQLNGIHR